MKENLLVKCPKCGEEFEVEIELNVDSKIDIEIKERIKMGEIFFHVCPKCGECVHEEYQFTYYDETRKTRISYGQLEVDALLALRTNRVNAINGSEERHIVAFSEEDLIEKVLCLDNDLDFRVIMCHDAMSKRLIKETLLNDKEGETIKVFYKQVSKEGKIAQVVIANNKEEKVYYEFNMKDYEDLKNRIGEDRLNKVNPQFFSQYCAEYLISEDFNKIFDTKHTYAFCELIENDSYKIVIVEVPSLLVDKIQTGDYVVCEKKIDLMKKLATNGKPMSNYYYAALVTDIFTLSVVEESKFYNDKNHYKICHISKNVDENILKNEIDINSISDFDITKIVKEDKIDSSIFRYIKFNKIALNSNVYIAIKKSVDEDEEEFYFDEWPDTFKYAQKMYVFLSKNAVIKNQSNYTFIKKIKLKDAIDMVLNNLYVFNGIKFVLENEIIEYPLGDVVEGMRFYYVGNQKRRSDVLKNLSQEEIEYIGIDRYKKICDVFVDKSLKELKQILCKMDLDEMNDLFNIIGNSLFDIVKMM